MKECVDCGREFESNRENAKYCYLCRLYRNLVFIADRKYECWACGEKFAPLARSDKFCGGCNTNTSIHHTEGTCSFCGEARVVLHEDVSVCLPCATDGEQRKLFVRAIHKKRGTS